MLSQKWPYHAGLPIFTMNMANCFCSKDLSPLLIRHALLQDEPCSVFSKIVTTFIKLRVLTCEKYCARISASASHFDRWHPGQINVEILLNVHGYFIIYTIASKGLFIRTVL